MQEPAELGPDALGEEHRTAPVELLWDLVFVFAVTQVTTLLAGHLGWAGFGQAMLVLALMWWAWSAFVWAANAQPTTSATLRFALLVSAMLIFITGLAVPRAFAGEAPTFVLTYAVVRLVHLGLYADASRHGSAAWAAISGFAVTVGIGMGLLIAGALVGGALRALLWTIAVAIDYAGPAWFTRERLRGIQRVAVAHFAERYSLFVIICLGESIVAIGLAATRGGRHLSAELVLAVSLALLITIGMWWTYFDRFASAAEEALRRHEDPVLAASDSYSYAHLVIVAGIITFAAGVRFLIGAVHSPLHASARLALCGGVALYLLGHVIFRLRLLGQLGREKLVVAVALLVLYAVGGSLPGWAMAAAIAALLACLCAAESVGAGEEGAFAADVGGKDREAEDRAANWIG